VETDADVETNYIYDHSGVHKKYNQMRIEKIKEELETLKLLELQCFH